MSSVIQNPEAERRERKFAAEQGAIAATTTKAIAVRDERPAVDRYLDEVTPACIGGSLIQVKKGKLVIGDDESEIGDSEDFICLADMTMIGWVKFKKDAPPDRIMGLLYDDFEMPERKTLGDL